MYAVILNGSFIDGSVVGYEVYEENDRLVLHPAGKADAEVFQPVLVAKHSNGKWLAEGTDNKKLIDQVIEAIRLKDHFLTLLSNPS